MKWFLMRHKPISVRFNNLITDCIEVHYIPLHNLYNLNQPISLPFSEQTVLLQNS